jgi:hypothetical protein
MQTRETDMEHNIGGDYFLMNIISKQQIEIATKSSALTVGTKPSEKNYSEPKHNAYKEWGGMYFRSSAEVAIASY